jgi:hypothetical protein
MRSINAIELALRRLSDRYDGDTSWAHAIVREIADEIQLAVQQAEGASPAAESLDAELHELRRAQKPEPVYLPIDPWIRS